MTKFLFIYRLKRDNYDNMSPEMMQQHHQKWQTWMSEGFEKGWMLDGGNGLKNEGHVVNSNKVITDGPFVEAKEMIGGYSIVQADSLGTAAELAKGCPVLLRSGSVEVRPFWDWKK